MDLKWAFIIGLQILVSDFGFAADIETESICGHTFQYKPKAYQYCLNIGVCNGASEGQKENCRNAYLAEARKIAATETEQVPDVKSMTPSERPAEGAAQAQNECQILAKQADSYCRDPIAYSSDNSIQAGGRENAQMAGQVLMLGSMYQQATGGSSRTLCDMIQKGGTATFAMNAMFAGRCTAFITDCENKCNAAAKGDPQHSSNYQAHARMCSGLRQLAAEMGSATGQSLMAATMGKNCKAAAESNDRLKITNTPPELAPPVNCATNPNDPICGNSGGGNTGSQTSIYDPSGGRRSGGTPEGDFTNLGNEGDEFDQKKNSGGASIADAKNAGVPGGGGQMLGGGGGGSGGGDDRGGRGGSSGYKTDILQGERSGGGYSGAAGGAPSAGGGWSGYGSGSDSTASGKGFDLSRYLPKDGTSPLRGPAGMNKLSVELGTVTDDLFKKNSDRFLAVCRTNRLKDCK